VHVAPGTLVEAHEVLVVVVEPHFFLTPKSGWKRLRLITFFLSLLLTLITIEFIEVYFLFQNTFDLLLLHQLSEVLPGLSLLQPFDDLGLFFVFSLQAVVPVLTSWTVQVHDSCEGLQLLLNFLHDCQALRVRGMTLRKDLCFGRGLTDDSVECLSIF